MKRILLISLLLQFASLSAQQAKYVYSDSLAYSGYESFSIKKDSFQYDFSLGLMSGTSKGFIETENDTLVLNSDLQPFKEINTSYDPALSNQFKVIVRNDSYRFVDGNFSAKLYHEFAFKMFKKGKFIRFIWTDSTLIRLERDTIHNSSCYYFHLEEIPKKYEIRFVVYRTNIEVPLDIHSENNQAEIIFNDLPTIVDYSFFSNQKAVYTKNGLTLIKDGRLERTHYLYKSDRYFKIKKRNGRYIRMSRKTVVKEYQKVPVNE